MKTLGTWTSIVLGVVALAGCGAAPPRPVTEPPQPPQPLSPCDAYQAGVSRNADADVLGDKRDETVPIAQHLAQQFPDGRISWLMREADYQKFVVATGAKQWGRCKEDGRTCYLFAAPTAVIETKVSESMTGEQHDPAKLGAALGLPASRFEGPLRVMTLDINKARTCARLPVCTDPGAWPCQSADDKDCFKFGGYTGGGVPEVMIINAPVDQTDVKIVP